MTRTGKVLLAFLGLSWAGLFAVRPAPEPGVRKFLNLAAAYQETGRFEEAITIYQVALDIQPHQPIALTNLAAIHMERGELNLAEPLLLESISYYPQFSSAYVNLAVVALRMGRFGEALGYLDQLEDSQMDFTTHLNRGEALRGLGRSCDAKRAYDEAFRLRPDQPITADRQAIGQRICPEPAL